MARNAILIGCDRFLEPDIFPPLRFPQRDVERLARLLSDSRHGYFDQVNTLFNPGVHEARRLVERVFSGSDPDDLTLLYYSGHGRIRRDGCLGLIVADTEAKLLSSTALGSDEIKSRLNEARSGQKVVILDCCFSGAFGPEGLKGDAAEAPPIDLRATATGSHVLTASARFEAARELESIGAGVLTHAIIRGIETGQAAPADRTVITLADLVQFVQSTIARDGQQVPQYWASESSGPVIIAKKIRVFDAAWVATARRAISVHESSDAIDLETADQARDSLRAASDLANRAEMELIDDLVSGRMLPVQFVRTWVNRRLTSARVRDGADSVGESAPDAGQSPASGKGSPGPGAWTSGWKANPPPWVRRPSAASRDGLAKWGQWAVGAVTVFGTAVTFAAIEMVNLRSAHTPTAAVAPPAQQLSVARDAQPTLPPAALKRPTKLQAAAVPLEGAWALNDDCANPVTIKRDGDTMTLASRTQRPLVATLRSNPRPGVIGVQTADGARWSYELTGGDRLSLVSAKAGLFMSLVRCGG